MLSKAPFFNRIKLWRKFKGHAVMGTSEPTPLVRGQSAAIIQKSRERRMLVEGAGGGGPGGGAGPGRGSLLSQPLIDENLQCIIFHHNI